MVRHNFAFLGPAPDLTTPPEYLSDLHLAIATELYRKYQLLIFSSLNVPNPKWNGRDFFNKFIAFKMACGHKISSSKEGGEEWSFWVQREFEAGYGAVLTEPLPTAGNDEEQLRHRKHASERLLRLWNCETLSEKRQNLADELLKKFHSLVQLGPQGATIIKGTRGAFINFNAYRIIFEDMATNASCAIRRVFWRNCENEAINGMHMTRPSDDFPPNLESQERRNSIRQKAEENVVKALILNRRVLESLSQNLANNRLTSTKPSTCIHANLL
ncbi:hypothetical protein EDC01DRAFT_634166 [Geopyxis carbonaria]|nr:hypothetical protein EDC01DRAFT_634166 [Geopyxis carbonaria]